MNTHLTAHPDPVREPLRIGTLPDAVTVKLGDEVTVILSDRDADAAEQWLLEAADALRMLARKVAVRAALRATA